MELGGVDGTVTRTYLAAPLARSLSICVGNPLKIFRKRGICIIVNLLYCGRIKYHVSMGQMGL